MKPVGYPHKPLNHMSSSCGTAVLAAILGIGTKEAETLIAKNRPKKYRGFTNVTDIRSVLENNGILFKHLKQWKNLTELPAITDDSMVAIFVQIDGPWTKEGGWRSAYSRTHWALIHGSMMMDVNNIHFTGSDLIPWVEIKDWKECIMPLLINCEPDATGWYVRGGYEVLEPKFL